MTKVTANVMRSRGMAGHLGDRFGGQAVRLLGAAEHRSERIR
jgi:hypothetical protein